MHRPNTLQLAVAVVLSFQWLAQGKEAGVKQPTVIALRRGHLGSLSFIEKRARKTRRSFFCCMGFLLLHGCFEPLFARLSDSYHLVAPDYPGFGRRGGQDGQKLRLHLRSPR